MSQKIDILPKELCTRVLRVTLTFLALCSFDSALALEDTSLLKNEAGIVEHLEKKLDLELKFKDQFGKNVSLGELGIANRPSILVPVYYECPRLCTLTLNAVVKAINEIPLELGQDFSLITFSFDPEETHELANKRALEFKPKLRPGHDGAAWHFLSGEKSSAEGLARAIGFGYKKDREDFSHSAAIVLLTPEGKISRYFYGIKYPAKDLELSLIEASRGKIGSSIHKVLLYCFRFDPTKGKYTLAIFNLVRVVSILVLAILSTFILSMLLKERKRRANVRTI